MKTLTILITLLAFTITGLPVTAQAAGRKAKNEVVMKMGSKVHLFHSSKTEVQKDIGIGDILPVYRARGKYQQQRALVGEVKVLSFIGDHYFEAEIVKGEVKVGDIATKENTGFLVQPAQ